MQTVNFQAPPDYSAEQEAIARQRKYAELMAEQANQPLQGQMAGQFYVAPSWTQGAAKMAQALSGRIQNSRVDEKQKALAEQIRAQGLKDTESFMGALNGKPEQAPMTPNDDEGNPNPMIPAMAGDKRQALAIALGSQNPMVRQAGSALMAQLLKAEEPYNLREGEVRMGPNGQVVAKNQKPREMKIAPGGQVYNPYEVKPGTVFADPNKPFAVGPDGKPVANAEFQSFELDKAKKGASNVTVKTDVKTGESLAGQVGGIMKDSTSGAEGAVKAVDAAQRIVNAVNSGKLIAGPGATPQVFWKQLGQKIGAGGKDDVEILANTRAAIRGLAELTLQGRQQMKGQGAITESEGALAEKANSGDIDKLTPAEIMQLAKASERAARFNYAQHERKMKAMRDNPSLQGVVPFYEAPSMPAETAPNAPVKRYNPATGTFE